MGTETMISGRTIGEMMTGGRTTEEMTEEKNREKMIGMRTNSVVGNASAKKMREEHRTEPNAKRRERPKRRNIRLKSVRFSKSETSAAGRRNRSVNGRKTRNAKKIERRG